MPSKKTIYFLIAISTFSIALLFTSQEVLASNRWTTILQGKIGSGNHEFGYTEYDDGGASQPSAIAIDSKGNIYIDDVVNDRILKFDKNGHLVSSISSPLGHQKHIPYLTDLTCDKNDNLYIAYYHVKSIFVYTPDGKPTRSISLEDKDIAWNDINKEWDSRRLFQIERLYVDRQDNIFIEAFNELIRISPAGNIMQKWAPVIRHQAPKLLLLDDGFVILPNEKGTVEEYHYNGDLKTSGECGSLFSRQINKIFCFLPWAMDAEGSSYWFEDAGSIIYAVKLNKAGQLVNKTQLPDIDRVDYSSKTVKYDRQGQLFVFYFDYKQKLFKLKKLNMK